jgi:hypothetical protein
VQCSAVQCSAVSRIEYPSAHTQVRTAHLSVVLTCSRRNATQRNATQRARSEGHSPNTSPQRFSTKGFAQHSQWPHSACSGTLQCTRHDLACSGNISTVDSGPNVNLPMEQLDWHATAVSVCPKRKRLQVKQCSHLPRRELLEWEDRAQLECRDQMARIRFVTSTPRSEVRVAHMHSA